MEHYQKHEHKDNQSPLPRDHLWPTDWDSKYPSDYQLLHPANYRSEREDEDFRSVRRLSWDDFIKKEVGDEI